jgi:gamma-glutamyltranspeptidase / glutathione hydrolase
MTGTLSSTRPELKGTFGMVASTHWLASASGMSVLERGGNAFDAAVAAGFVLQIVEPHLNGPGGDMPVIVHSAETERTDVICGQGTFPDSGHAQQFRDQGITSIPAMGLLPATVPGAFGAWLTVLRNYGTWRLRDVLDYAIGYARNGYPLVPGVPARIAGVEDLFRAEWPTSAEIYLPNNRVPKTGDLFRNVPLADTYERIVRESEAGGGTREAQIDRAMDSWYRGFVAEAIDKFFRATEVIDDTGERRKGLLTADDMANWKVETDEPRTYDYGDWRVFKTAPWGQGPVFLQQLALLKGYDIATMDLAGPEFIHLVAESAKLAFADRDAWYGDPNAADDYTADLLSDDYNAERRCLITDAASADFRPGSVRGLTPIDARIDSSELLQTLGGGGEPTMQTAIAPGDTCHLDVVDKWGNMVSATPSGGWLQSSPIIPGLGFCMGTRGQVFNLIPGHPNEAAPNKRPRTTLTPSFAIGPRKVAFGTPGGDQQDQWSLIFFLRMLYSGKDMQQIIDMPSFHTESLISSFYPHEFVPGRLVVEDRVAAETVEDLRKRGHDVKVVDGWTLGRLSAVSYEGGYLRAAANARLMQGYAVGR